MAIFYFRNDDVNILDEELVNVTRRCTEQGVPITHAVEPANVTDEAAAWLRAEKSNAPRLIEIMQHGYDHRKRDKGEFGGNRPYDDQRRDLAAGKRILRDRFGDGFLPCLNFPFGPYNAASMQAASDLGYRIVNSHYNCRPSRRLLYVAGHALRRGRLLDRHVSWHLDRYPGTRLYCIDMAVSFIARYRGEYGSRDCDFHGLPHLLERIAAFRRHTPVIGILLHHRFHTTPASLDLITAVIESLRKQPETEFLNLGEIHARYRPRDGLEFQDEI